MLTLARWLARFPVPAAAALLVVLALIVLFPGQTALPATDRDEARFVQATKQMMETGDFVDIRFQSEPRHNKPAGVYWLQAASAALAGGTEAPVAAYRVPSWVGAALAVGLTAWALGPLIGAPAAMLGALMLGASVLLHAEARIAKTDAALLAAIVLAMGALARLWLAERPARGVALLFWVAVGTAVLLKGPIVALPVLGALGAMMLAARRWPSGLEPKLGALVLALMVGPWLIAITVLSEGGFWQASLGRDLLAKITAGRESHGAPPGTYLSLFFATFWPFAVLAPVAGVWLWRQRREPHAAFLLGWIVPTWLVFELVPTKLPHYVLPIWPAVAGVVAASLIDGRPWAAVPDRWLRGLAGAAFALPALALVGFAALAVPLVEGRAAWLALGLALAAAVPLALAGRALWHWQPGRFVTLGAAGAVLAYTGVLHGALPALDSVFPAPRMAAAAAAWRCGAEGPVAVTGFREPSVVFALGTDTFLTEGAGAGVVLRDGRASLAFVADEHMADFAAVIGSRATALTRIEGFNYNRGRPVALTLYAVDRRSGEPCLD